MVKAIFFDIDGTLIVPFADNFTADVLACLKLLKEKGIKLFISTGRPFKRIGWLKDLFDFDGYVTFNGQYVVGNDGETINLKYLDEEDIFNTIEYCEENKIGLCVYDLQTNYKNDYADPYTKVGWHSIKEVKRGNKYNQMLLFQSKEEENGVLSHTKNIKTVRWNNVSCDMILKSGGKDKGIEALLKHYNIDKKETMAFGDGGNDIDMLKYCNIGVAMGNAGIDVKLSADYVTTNVDDYGLIKAFEHFEIITSKEASDLKSKHQA